MKDLIERVVAWWRAIGRGGPDLSLDRVLVSLERERFEQRALLESMWKLHVESLNTLACRIVEAVQAANPVALDPDSRLEALSPLPEDIRKAVDVACGGDRNLRETLVDYAVAEMAEGREPADIAKSIRKGSDLNRL